ncbi:MAG TPA: glycosyl hydrolase family 28-related protein, partial [Ktedonobacteraceae bacterium]|nr:glycosyl hydrolase family 28-related protein [Ktedonobacteraceae bacterium]
MQDAWHRMRTKSLGVLISFFLIISTLGVIVTTMAHTQSARASAAGGTGATLPYVELEAHSANTTGTILGPDFSLGSLASDAVDRQAVQLIQGKFVEFTLPQAANSINLRYSIPDASGGGGATASLSIYINGTKQANDLQLTSKYSWVYGAPDFSNCNANVWSNSPGGTAHHQFDEMHVRLPEMGVNTKVKLQVDAENTAAWYAIDVADFQEVPTALGQPAGSISVTSAPYNADPTGNVDATQAIQNAVNAGASQGKTVWIPTGNYLVTNHILVNNVTLTGAGPWYSVLGGAPTSSTGNGVGVYGNDVYDG